MFTHPSFKPRSKHLVSLQKQSLPPFIFWIFFRWQLSEQKQSWLTFLSLPGFSSLVFIQVLNSSFGWLHITMCLCPSQMELWTQHCPWTGTLRRLKCPSRSILVPPFAARCWRPARTRLSECCFQLWFAVFRGRPRPMQVYWGRNWVVLGAFWWWQTIFKSVCLISHLFYFSLSLLQQPQKPQKPHQQMFVYEMVWNHLEHVL